PDGSEAVSHNPPAAPARPRPAGCVPKGARAFGNPPDPDGGTVRRGEEAYCSGRCRERCTRFRPPTGGRGPCPRRRLRRRGGGGASGSPLYGRIYKWFLIICRTWSVVRRFFSVISARRGRGEKDRKSTRLNSSHVKISYAVFCLKKKKDVQLEG